MKRLDRLLGLASALYLAGMLLLAVLLHHWGDAWWPATVLLFAPRWPWAVPGALLLGWALWRGRRWRGPLLLALAAWWLGVLPFNLPAPATWWPGNRQGELRVVSYNIGGVNTTTPAVVDLLDRLRPDVMLLQECGGTVKRAQPALQALGWTVMEHTGSCLVTRLKVRQVVEHDPSVFWKLGGNGIGVRYDLAAPGLAFSVLNIHPETPREGLEAVMHHGPGGAARMDEVTELRAMESAQLATFARQASGPLLVTGDFNMPVQSAIYRRYWGDFTNAFSHAGWGQGGTKVTRWHRLRIDHVLAGPGWRVHGAWVGPHVGGDHRPMVAELSWDGR